MRQGGGKGGADGREKGRGGREGRARAKPGNLLVYYIKLQCPFVCLSVPPPPFSTRPSDCNQIWHTYSDRYGTGSHLKKLTHPTPGVMFWIQCRVAESPVADSLGVRTLMSLCSGAPCSGYNAVLRSVRWPTLSESERC